MPGDGTATARRDLRLLAGAVFLSATGDLLALLTLALVVHDLTGSAFAVSALFATTMVPVVALAPAAGLIADRFESVRVMALASLTQAAVAIGLATVTGDLGAILVLSALLTAGSAISQPAEFALVPHLAGAERLARANGVMESARYAGYAAGPALAGLLLAAGGAKAALLVNAASFLAIALAAAFMRTRRPGRERAPGASEERARQGAAVLWGDPVLRPVLGAAVAALLLISASMTIDVFFVTEVLGAGELGYALVILAWMAGMVGGATRIAPRVPATAGAAAALLALMLQGAGVMLPTAWTVLPFALVGYGIGGVGHGIKNTLLRTLIQERVPARVHGRAFAAYNAARNTAELAALAGGGVLVAALGARHALLVAGLGPVVAGGIGLLLLNRRAPAHRKEAPSSSIAGCTTHA